MVLLNPLAAPFTPSEGLAPPPPWPALSCSSLSSSLPSYTLHDLILAVLTAYKQGLFDAHIASPLRSYANPPPPTVITPSDDPPSLSSPSVADIDSGSAAPLPHPSPSLQQGDVPPTAVPTAAADNPTPPTISPPLDYSCLIDSLSLGKSGYPLVVPSKSRRSSSTRPTVKPCISSGTHRQHNRSRKPGHRSTKSSSESPKKTTIISPTRPRVPSPPIIRPSSPTPIPTHNRFDTITIPEEENSTDFALAILQPLINQAINDAENKFVVRSVLTDICDRVLSNVVVTVDTPSIHPTPSSITKKQRKNKKKNKEVSVVTSSNALSSTTDICSSPPPPSVPSLVDTNLASISTPIDSNINEAERLSTIVEEKVDLEIEMKENPIIASVQPLSSSQSKKLKKQNKMVKKEVVANRTRNKTRAARRTKKQEKELEGLSHEEIGEKLREILAECAGKKGSRLDDDMDEECVWYDPNCDIAEEDLMEFGNGW